MDFVKNLLLFSLVDFNGILSIFCFPPQKVYSEEGKKKKIKQRDDDCHRWYARPVGAKKKTKKPTCYALAIVLEKRPRTLSHLEEATEWKPVNCTNNRINIEKKQKVHDPRNLDSLSLYPTTTENCSLIRGRRGGRGGRIFHLKEWTEPTNKKKKMEMTNVH